MKPLELIESIITFQIPENEVMFSMVVGNNSPDQYFSIDSQTGVITVNERVSYDPAKPARYIVSTSMELSLIATIPTF